MYLLSTEVSDESLNRTYGAEETTTTDTVFTRTKSDRIHGYLHCHVRGRSGGSVIFYPQIFIELKEFFIEVSVVCLVLTMDSVVDTNYGRLYVVQLSYMETILHYFYLKIHPLEKEGLGMDRFIYIFFVFYSLGDVL